MIIGLSSKLNCNLGVMLLAYVVFTRYHERAIVLNNALTELLEMYAAAGGHLQDLSSLPPNLAQALIREPQGEG